MKLVRYLSTLLCVAALAVAGAAIAADKKKEVNEYPNATRAEPKIELSEKAQKQINAAFQHIDQGNFDAAEELLNKVLNGRNPSPYEQALAHQAIGQIKWEHDDYAGAIELTKKAVDLNAMPNKNQFPAIYQLAQLNLMEERYDATLEAIDRWFKETGKETAEAWALRGNALYRQDKYQAAVDALRKAMAMSSKPNESWTQIVIASYYELEQFNEAAKLGEEMLAKDPTNKSLIKQLSAIYLNGEMEPKALALMIDAKAKGLVTTEDDYRQLGQLYNFLERPKDAAAVMTEGLQAGILKPSLENYKTLGDAHALAEDNLNAIDAYTKAAAFATDGEMDFQRGHLLIEVDRYKEAREALLAAFAKGGIKRQGEAYILLGNAEYELENIPAAVAAYEKARAFPNTKGMAEAWLKTVRK